jgi:hypothetical protein
MRCFGETKVSSSHLTKIFWNLTSEFGISKVRTKIMQLGAKRGLWHDEVHANGKVVKLKSKISNSFVKWIGETLILSNSHICQKWLFDNSDFLERKKTVGKAAGEAKPHVTTDSSVLMLPTSSSLLYALSLSLGPTRFSCGSGLRCLALQGRPVPPATHRCPSSLRPPILFFAVPASKAAKLLPSPPLSLFLSVPRVDPPATHPRERRATSRIEHHPPAHHVSNPLLAPSSSLVIFRSLCRCLDQSAADLIRCLPGHHYFRRAC